MFFGSIPAAMRSILAERVRGWRVADVFVGCSGNLTVERVLAAAGTARLHGNDVTLYSCALGSYFAGTPLELTVAAEHRDRFGWLDAYLDTPSRTLATVLLASRFAQTLGRDGNAYYRRLRDGYRAQFSDLHARTVNRVEAESLTLASFASEDVHTWIDSVPKPAGVIAYPPFFAGDYAAMYAKLEQLLAWPEAPAYAELSDDSRQGLFEKIARRRCWLYGAHERMDGRDRWLRGVAQTTSRGHPIYLYSGSGPTRLARPRQQLELVRAPRLGADEEVGGTLTIARLSGGQFAALRSAYMNRHIVPGTPSAMYAVLADGKLIGAYALTMPKAALNLPAAVSGPYMYLLSDFPVAPSRHERLSKLVLYALLSRESQLLAERIANGRVRQLVTTAFSDRPQSMKYRGLFRLLSRKPVTPPRPDGKLQLLYVAELGRHTLAEGLAEWKARHA